jgi:hypothetical protein
MKRASYKDAVDWVAGNDDCEWAEFPHGDPDACATPSVSACLVRDLFGVDEIKIRTDVQRCLIDNYRCRVATAPAYDGKPTWHGEYYFDGSWYKVRNADAQPLAYASDAAALAGAKLTIKKRYATPNDHA